MQALRELIDDKNDDGLPFNSTVNEARVLACVKDAFEEGAIDAQYRAVVRQWINFNRFINQYEEGDYCLWVAAIYSKLESLLGTNDESECPTGAPGGEPLEEFSHRIQ